MLLRIAICDDESNMHQILKKNIDDFARMRNMDIVYKNYYTGVDLLESRAEFDIIFMDYQIDKDNKTNGMEISRNIREKDTDTAIIFLTSYRQVVFSSFEVNAFRFLTKPLEQEKLFQALDAYLRSIEKNDVLIIRIDGVSFRTPVNQITYLEGNGKYCILHTLQKLYDVHETLAAIEERLPGEYFSRCHRSFLIHLKHIFSYNSVEVELQNKERITVSRNKYKSFHDDYVNYIKKYGY